LQRAAIQQFVYVAPSSRLSDGIAEYFIGALVRAPDEQEFVTYSRPGEGLHLGEYKSGQTAVINRMQTDR
jgi:hypothetical protein